MQPTFVTSLFLAFILPVNVFAQSFCSKCPRNDNAGHPLQAEFQEAAYVHCKYKDTDCYYGPRSSAPNNLAYSYPATACPATLGSTICTDPIPPVAPTLLNTKCPDTNQAFIHTPVRSQPSNPTYIQCHYSNSECYYDMGTELLVDSISIPRTVFGSTLVGCRPRLVPEHLQYGS